MIVDNRVVTGARSLWLLAVEIAGAPRPMKMGTIASPWRYDAAADQSLQLANLRSWERDPAPAGNLTFTADIEKTLRAFGTRRFGSLLNALYLTRFQVSVGTNGPSGDGMGARTYVMSSPLMMLIVAFCSVPSKFGFVEP